MLAGQHHRLDRVGQLVDVEDRHALQLGHTVEVIVIGQDRTFQLTRQHHQLIVHFAHALGVDVADAHQDVRQLLQLRQHFHAAASALAAQAIRRVGDVLQLIQHKARDEQGAGQEACLGDICHAPVDDHACIQ